MRDFDYEAPTSLDAAIALLTQQGPAARPLAGGTDLIDHVRTGRLQPDLLVDLKKIPELNVCEVTARGARIGASVPCCRICESADIHRHYTALGDSCSIIGGIQIQNRASVGGNLCNSGPAADSTPALIALSAVCVIQGLQGRREVPVESFCTGPGTNVLQPGELLVEIRLPAPSPHCGSHYRRFIPRNEMDIAVVGVGACVELDAAGERIVSARVALGAVAPTPVLVDAASQILAGHSVGDEQLFDEVAKAAQAAISPINDMRGTIEFRTHVTGVLTKRVVREAVARARTSLSKA